MGNDPSYFILTVSCKQLGDQPAWSCPPSQQFSVAKLLSDVWKAYQPFKCKRVTLLQLPPGSCWLKSLVLLGKQVLAGGSPPTASGDSLGRLYEESECLWHSPSTKWGQWEPGLKKREHFWLMSAFIANKGWHGYSYEHLKNTSSSI